MRQCHMLRDPAMKNRGALRFVVDKPPNPSNLSQVMFSWEHAQASTWLWHGNRGPSSCDIQDSMISFPPLQ